MSNIFLAPFHAALGQLRRRREIADEGPAQSDNHSSVIAGYDKLALNLIEEVDTLQKHVNTLETAFEEERVHHRRLGIAFDEIVKAKQLAEEQIESLRDGLDDFTERLDRTEQEFDDAVSHVEKKMDNVKKAADDLVKTTTGGPFRPNNPPAPSSSPHPWGTPPPSNPNDFDANPLIDQLCLLLDETHRVLYNSTVPEQVQLRERIQHDSMIMKRAHSIADRWGRVDAILKEKP
jgi:hypothetical protein